ncbi:MAG TPA: ABC transporter permease [Acidimicrobiales bacterium]
MIADVIADAVTIAGKELKEILSRGGTARGRRGMIGTVVRPALVGLLFGLNIGRGRSGAALAVLPVAFFAMATASALVADTIAGERERHTLETLLVSPASDESILAGKLGAVVLYAWAVALIQLLAVAVTGIALSPAHRVSAGLIAVVALFALLEATLSAALGVQFSVRAATVRAAARSQAQVGIVLSLLAGGANFAVADPRLGGPVVAGAAFVVLVAADAVLLGLARARFRRGRLLVA